MAKKKTKKTKRRPKNPVVRGIWDRMDKEGAKHFAAFSLYRNTPAKLRSIKRCCEAYWGRSDINKIHLWERWSVRFEWIKRVAAYEDYLDQIVREELEESLVEMRKRHIKFARALQIKAAKKLEKIDPGDLSNHELIRFLTEAVNMERLAMGTPSEIIGFEDVDVLGMTDEELKELAES